MCHCWAFVAMRRLAWTGFKNARCLLRVRPRQDCRDREQPPREFIYTPLSDAEVTKRDVVAWWQHQRYDLAVDSARSNCVYCFMKGPRQIAKLAAVANSDTAPGPANIEWWADMEDRYGTPADDGSGTLGMLTAPSVVSFASTKCRLCERNSSQFEPVPAVCWHLVCALTDARIAASVSLP